MCNSENYVQKLYERLDISSGLNLYGAQHKMLYYKDIYGFFFLLKGKIVMNIIFNKQKV